MIVAICPFIAKLGINAGASIEVVLSAGPALLLQEIGNLGTIFLALPFALLLGLKREAIGATHSINRESNLALVTDLFGPDSPEARGSLSIYVVGGMVGTIYFGFLATMTAAAGIFHPYALGMASGVGAGILIYRNTYTGVVNRGKRAEINGNDTKAEALYLKAIEKKGEKKEAYFRLASLYHDQNKDDDADALLQEAVDSHPDSVGVYQAMVEYYEDTDQTEKIAYLMSNLYQRFRF